jgi:hypothetical protein
MAEQTSLYSAAPIIGTASGATVSFMLMNGTWKERIVAALCGAIANWIGTPLFYPIVFVAISSLYKQLGIDPKIIDANAVPGFTWFVIGLVGIDLCIWIIERTHRILTLLRVPFQYHDDI